MRIDVLASDVLDYAHVVLLYPNATCTGTEAYVYQPSHKGSYTETLVPGVPVKAGTGFSAKAIGTGLETQISVTGYTVPAAAVP